MKTQTNLRPLHPYIAEVDRIAHQSDVGLPYGSLNYWRGLDYGPAGMPSVRVTYEDDEIHVHTFDGYLVASSSVFSKSTPYAAIAAFVGELIGGAS